MAHPPRWRPPLRSSSGPPNPCIAPSTETLVVVVNLMSWSPRRTTAADPFWIRVTCERQAYFVLFIAHLRARSGGRRHLDPAAGPVFFKNCPRPPLALLHEPAAHLPVSALP